jgi:hypothetical protein
MPPHLIPGALLDRLRRTRGQHAGLRQATMGLPRWLAGLGAALLLAVAVVLAVVGVPEPISGVGDAVDNLLRTLSTALVLGALAYLWFYFWTSDRATRHLRQAARRAPEQLFSIPPPIGSTEFVFGRERLVEEITASLRTPFRAGPQIVVGDTGSGKTTLLLALATHLARELGVLPIVLTLRDLEALDFTELAMQRFREQIDPYIRTGAEADKLWRWMRHRGQIVVLADDLDRAALAGGADPYKTQIRLALDAARRRDLPLVVASRPGGVPPDLDEPPIELSKRPLEIKHEHEARNYVVRLAGKRPGDSDAERLVDANIEAGTLIDNAFYLGLLAELLRAGHLDLPPSGGEHTARLALLDARRKRLRGEATVDEAERARREQALQRVERFAAARLSPDSEQTSELDWLDAVRDGERLGLLRLDQQAGHRFRHDVLHAYFASRVLRADRRTWTSALRETPDAARVQLALVLAAADSRDDEFCRDVCSTLLADSEAVTADQRLLRAAAAAEVARAGGFGEHDDEIAGRCLLARPDASPMAKRAALDQLQQLGGERAVDALWEYGGDDDYGIRWAAVEKLVERCSDRAGADAVPGPSRYFAGADAYEVVDLKIEAALNRARPLLGKPEKERPDDWQPEIVPLKQMAWMLPALRTGVNDAPLSARIGARLRDLLDLERKRVTPQRGLEASVAQGFKLDAKLHPEEAVDADALDLLRAGATFWYSQLNLLHAVAIRLAHDADADPAALAEVLAQLEERERRAKRKRPDGISIERGLHPLVKAAADFCSRALSSPPERRPAEIAGHVWDDEGVVVSGRPVGLDAEAAQLAGEITVLLNLNETGSFEQRREFGEEPTMPYCMQDSRSRDEFFKGCHEACRFRLCPFQPATDQLSAHREISRAFCRDQRINASARTARRWGSQVSKRSLPQFWRWLESRARI